MNNSPDKPKNIKTFLTSKESISAYVWLAIVITTFLVAIICEHYWKWWNLGAIISTFFYATIFYQIDLTKNIMKNITSKEEKSKLQITINLIIIGIAIISFFIILLQQELPIFNSNSNLIISQLLITALPIMFWFTDHKIKSALFNEFENIKCNDKEKERIKNEAYKYQNFIIYVDIPAFIALLIIFLFSSFEVILKKTQTTTIHFFVSGASAFQLIAFSSVFTLLLIYSFIEKKEVFR